MNVVLVSALAGDCNKSFPFSSCFDLIVFRLDIYTIVIFHLIFMRGFFSMQTRAHYVDFCIHYWVQIMFNFYKLKNPAPVKGWIPFEPSTVQLPKCTPEEFLVWLLCKGIQHLKCCISYSAYKAIIEILEKTNEIEDKKAFREFLDKYDPIGNLTLNNAWIEEAVNRMTRYLKPGDFKSVDVAKICDKLAGNILKRETYCDLCLRFRYKDGH